MNTFIEQHLARLKLKDSLVENYDYIEWLYKFTEVYHTFANDDWIYEKTALSELDYKNVENLYLFVYAIQEYFENNLVPLYSQNFSVMLSIKYNNVFFEFDILTGQGTRVYVKKSRQCDLPVFVKFEDIVNNVQDKNFEIKHKKLLELETLIKELQDLKVPYNNVKRIINNYNIT